MVSPLPKIVTKVVRGTQPTQTHIPLDAEDTRYAYIKRADRRCRNGSAHLSVNPDSKNNEVAVTFDKLEFAYIPGVNDKDIELCEYDVKVSLPTGVSFIATDNIFRSRFYTDMGIGAYVETDISFPNQFGNETRREGDYKIPGPRFRNEMYEAADEYAFGQLEHESACKSDVLINVRTQVSISPDAAENTRGEEGPDAKSSTVDEF